MTTTDTQLTITLAALAERMRSQADALRADAAARRLAEYRADVASLLAAAQTVPTGELGPQTLAALADLADHAAAGNCVATTTLNDWTAGARTLPAALYARCPAAQKRAVAQARRYVAQPRPFSAPAAQDRELLPDDLRAQVVAVAEAEAARKAERKAEAEAEAARKAAEHKAADERKAAQLTVLARHYLGDDPVATEGWEAGEVRTQEVTGRARADLTDGLTLRRGDDVDRVDRVSVDAYRAQRRVLASITTAAQRIGEAAGLPVTVARTCYERHSRTWWDDVGDAERVDRWYTADYTVTVGDVRWIIEDVVLD